MQANAATVGESVDKQEEYRVQLQLTEAVLKDGTEWTQKLNDQIALTSERAGEAKLQLAQHEFALQKLNTASQAVGSALSTAFSDAIVEGKKFSDVMTSLVQTLEKAAINQLVMSFFTTPSGGGTSIFATALKGIGFAGGTDYAPGGLAMVGEQGPELVNLPRGSQVIPNDATRKTVWRRQCLGAGGVQRRQPRRIGRRGGADGPDHDADAGRAAEPDCRDHPNRAARPGAGDMRVVMWRHLWRVMDGWRIAAVCETRDEAEMYIARQAPS